MDGHVISRLSVHDRRIRAAANNYAGLAISLAYGRTRRGRVALSITSFRGLAARAVKPPKCKRAPMNSLPVSSITFNHFQLETLMITALPSPPCQAASQCEAASQPSHESLPPDLSIITELDRASQILPNPPTESSSQPPVLPPPLRRVGRMARSIFREVRHGRTGPPVPTSGDRRPQPETLVRLLGHTRPHGPANTSHATGFAHPISSAYTSQNAPGCPTPHPSRNPRKPAHEQPPRAVRPST
jgi:hypothetical protein